MGSTKLAFGSDKNIKLILIFVFLFFVQKSYSQTTLLNEGFETDGEGTRYDSTWIENGNNYFQQRPASDFTGLSNVTGTGVLAARRIDDSEPQNPAHPVAVFRTKSINISGFDNITLNLDIAANTGVFNLNQDSLIIYYAFDADIASASFTKIGAFHPALTSESDFVEDDDLDGAPGPSTNTLNGALTNYSYSIPGTGDDLMIRILIFNSANDEIMIFDELEVTGTPIVTLTGLNPSNGSLSNNLSSITLQYDQNISAGTAGTITINGPTSATKDIVADAADFDFSTANEVTIDLSGTAFADGPYTVDVDAGIFQGATSEPNLAIDGSTQWSFTLDATDPAAPVITGITNDTGTSSNDGITNDQTLIINGTAEANSIVTLSLAGTGVLSNSIAVDGAGNWSFDYSGTTLTETTHIFSATTRDAAGNISPASANFNVEVDLSINTPLISGITDDTGSSTNDEITNDQTLIISGTADPNSTVTLNLSGTGVLSSAIPVNGSGNWSFDYSGTTLPAGSYVFTASATDAAGNTSGNSADFTVEIDNTISTPVITGISDDNGSSSSDGITNDQNIIISGTAEANSIVTLTLAGTGILSSSIAVNGSGNWSFDFTGTTLPAGNYTFNATATDLAGNVSGSSANFDIQIDVSPPAAPSITGITTDTGTSSTDGITSDQTLIISGTADANTLVSLSLSGTGVLDNNIAVNGSGNWTFDYTGTTLPAGNYTFTAASSDIAGNTSGTSPNFNIEVDISINAPVITGITDDTGSSTTDRITNDQTIILSGTAEANSTVTLNLSGTGILSSTIPVNGAGSWSFDYTGTTLPPNTYAFTATVTDIAGNTSSNSANFIVEIDNSINNPVITGISNDNGFRNTDEITNDQTLIISGTAEAGSTVTLNQAGVGVLSNSILVNGSGNWSFDYTGTSLPAGNYNFTATATDLAGNISGVSPNFDVEIDITSPAVPSITAVTDDTGISASDEITNDQTLIISGSAALNTQVTLSLAGTGILSNAIIVDGSGNWTFDYTGTTLPQGTATFTAVTTDIAGNTSGSTPAFNVEIDITANAPVITGITTDTGISATDEITNDQTLIISGTAEAGSIVTLNQAGTGVLSNSIPVNGAGNWSFDYTGTTLPPGSYTFSASTTDQAGNVSGTSSNFVVEIDIAAPVAPTLVSISNDTGISSSDQNTSDQTIIITGTSEVNSTVTLSLAGVGVLSNTINVNGSGNWTFDYSATTLPDGTYTFSAFATDFAGNVGAASSNFLVTIDATNPALFTTGNVVANGGTVRNNFWNATNTSLAVTIPIDNDMSLSGGVIQITGSVNDAAFANLGSAITINGANLGGSQMVNITEAVFEAFNVGLIDTDTVEFNAIITDVAGNTTTGNQSIDAIIIDQSVPVIRDNEISLNPNDAGVEIITFTLNEELELAENAAVTGLTTSTGAIASAVYSSKGVLNLITLTSNANDDWNQSTTVSYNSASGNILDVAGNELVNISGLAVEINVVNLSAGDIAFTSYRSDNPDAFSFVLLKDIVANTEINFTDNGYRSDGAFSSASGDNTITWSTNENLFAGTEIIVTGLTASRGSISGTAGLQHTNSGDQILAYQGSNSQPTFITAINWNGFDWVTTLTSNSESRSTVPPGLTDGINAIHMTDDDEDNGAYEFATEITSGTVNALRNSLIDNTHWDLSDNTSNVDFPTVGDNYILPPNREGTVPVNGGRIAADFASFQIDFDENVSKSSLFGGEISFIQSGAGTIATLDISNSAISINNDIVNIDISSVLPLLVDETTYEVNVDGFLFVNADGNHNDSIVGSTDWSFVYDGTPPQVSSIARLTGSNNPEIDDNGVTFTVTFDDDVTGVDITDFTLSGNAASIATVSLVRPISSTVYEVDVTGIDLNNNLLSGSLRLDLDDDNSILDDALNPLGGNGIQDFTSGESFTIIHPVPAAHVTGFNINGVATTSTSITLQWTESTTEQLPNRYLILVRESSSSFITVNDGTLYNDSDISDGQGAFNTSRGNSSIVVPGLTSGTSYFFRIIPYTNDGANTFYRTAATIPEVNGTTLVAQLTTIDFARAISSIPATTNSQADAALLTTNLSFDILDDGGVTPDPDNAPTLINQMVITQGANNDVNLANWTDIIAGAELRDNSGNIITGTVNPTDITFSLDTGEEEIGEIDDNENKRYALRVWLSNNLNATLRDTIDGLNFEFEILSTGITVESLGSSGIATGENAASGAGNNEIEVSATGFVVLTSPAAIEGINQPLNQNGIIEVRDPNNNLDLDYTGFFTLNTPEGGASFSNPTDNFVDDGQLYLDSLRYISPGLGDLTISDPAAILTSASTSSVDVIHTVFSDAVSGLSDSPLQPADGERAIFGFSVASSTRTINEPIFPGFTIRFDQDIIGIFENFRVFESSDNVFDLITDEVLTTTNTPGLTVVQNTASLDVAGLNRVLTGSPQFFFIVVDVTADVSEATPSVTASLTTSDIAIPATSGSISNFNFDGPSYLFLDQRPPQVLGLIPEGNNVSTDTDLTIIFDEPVQSTNSQVRVFTANDNTFVGEAFLVSSSSVFNDTLVFDFPGLFEPDREYFVNISPGVIIDDSRNEFPGFQTSTDWRFRTADSDPPIFLESSPQEDFVFSEGFDIRIKMDEIGTAYFMVFESPDPTVGQEPGVNDLIDDTYTGAVSPIVYDSIDITEDNQNFFTSITGLNNNTNYNVFVVARDLANNRQSMVTSFTVNTLSSDPSGIRLSNPVISVCSGDFQQITEPIHIMEGGGSSGDFSSGVNQTIDLALPTGYEFYTGSDTPPSIEYFVTGDISAQPTIDVINSGLARITFSVSSGNNGIDRMTINGLRIQAVPDAVSGDLIKFSGSSTDLPDNAVLAQFELTPEIPVDFEFGTGTDAVGNNQSEVSLIPDPSIFDTGINTFSGPGVQGEVFFTNLAGIGTHTITLVHETDFGCISSFSQDITVFDNSDVISGLLSNYCTNDLSAITIVGPSNQTIGSNIFNLVQLAVDPMNSNIEAINQVVLDETNAPAIWTVDFDGAGVGQVAFRARFQNRSDPSDIRERTQFVTISNPPELALELVNNFGPTLDGINFCEGEGNIEIQGAIVNFNPDFEYIQTVLLDIDNDGNPDALPTGTLTDNGDGTAEINIDLLSSIPTIFDGPINILYTVTNQTTVCEITEVLTIFVHGKPQALFSTDLGCVDVPLTFDNLSTVESSSIIRDYVWDFDDSDNATGDNPNTSIVQEPNHTYINNGTYNVSLEVTSDFGCKSDTLISVDIGNNPIVSYTYEQIGIDRETIFNASVSNVTDDEIRDLTWTFDMQAQPAITTNFEAPFNFQFINEGIHDVELEVITDNGCIGNVNDSIFTVRVVDVTSDTTYFADFENSDKDGWIGWGINSSWDVGTSGGTTITEGASGTGDRFWTTGVGVQYNDQEESFVYSPIFNLSNLQRPLLILNTFNNTNEQNDGIVLQYTTDDDIIGDREWIIVGNIGTGINWYNTGNIQNAPGDQVVDLIGWSEEDSLWRESRHALNGLDVDRIQFRLAFRSGENRQIDPLDGFAFDNVEISERTRNVLIESFVNTSPSGDVALDESNLLDTLFSGGNNGIDFIKMNYHTDFPGFDPINQFNVVSPSARAVYYNIRETPRTVIDGNIFNDDLFSEWGADSLLLRALSSADYSIGLTTAAGDNGSLDIEASITPKLIEGENILVFAAVLEKEITLNELTARGADISEINTGQTVFNFVLRNLLPDAAGLRFSTNDLEVGTALPPISFNWVPENIELSDMAVVVFVQNEETREIYQAEIMNVTDVISPVTGIEDLLNQQLTIFPNPANDKVTIDFGQRINQPAFIKIYDNFGKQVMKQQINTGAVQLEVDTKLYVPGLYHIQLSLKEKDLALRRLMILH